MKLDVYRSCSWTEKRQVLEAFWRRGVTQPKRIEEAAVQYGAWAIVCLVVLALELVPVIVVSVGRGSALAWVGLALQLGVLLSLLWSVVRYQELRRTPRSAIAS